MGMYLLSALAGSVTTIVIMRTINSWLKRAYNRGYNKGYNNGSNKERQMAEARLETMRKASKANENQKAVKTLQIIGKVNQDGTIGRVVGEA